MIDEQLISKFERGHQWNIKRWQEILEAGSFNAATHAQESFAYDEHELFTLHFEATQANNTETLDAMHEKLLEELPLLARLCALGVKLDQIHSGLAASSNKALKDRIVWLKAAHNTSYSAIILAALSENEIETLSSNNLGYMRGWSIQSSLDNYLFEDSYGNVDWPAYWKATKKTIELGKQGNWPS